MLFLSIGLGGDTVVRTKAADRFLSDSQSNVLLSSSSHNWWEFGLGDPIVDEVALFYLGHTYFQGADIGEVLQMIYRMNQSRTSYNNNITWSWFNEFTRTTERLEGVAEQFEAQGHALSAGQTFLCAATYCRASLHRHPDPFHPEVPFVTQQAVQNWDKFLNLTNFPCEYVQIPYEDTTLPGYLCLATTSDLSTTSLAPTIIYHQGKDGWMEDEKIVVDEAQKRGKHFCTTDHAWEGQSVFKDFTSDMTGKPL